jgi:hypothetical protein
MPPNVEPFEYLRNVICRMADYPHKNLADLLPAVGEKIKEDTNQIPE